MKIALLGAGAMGTLFGARLGAAGHEVVMIDVDRARLENLNNEGLRVRSPRGVEVTRAPAQLAETVAGHRDLVIVFTKRRHTAAAVQSVRHLLGSETLVLSLQNGLGAPNVIEGHVPRDRILFGVTEHSADLEPTGEVYCADGGKSRLWTFGDPDPNPAPRVAALLSDARLPCIADPDVGIAIWEKAAFNGALNPLATVLGGPVGCIADHPDGRALALAAVTEAVAVARASGVAADIDRVIRLMNYALETHRDHKPSMLQDRLAGRSTEIDDINGQIVAQGAQVGIEAPVNQTLLRLVHILESSGSA